MDIGDLQKHWDEFGKSNPMWAILTSATEWNEEAFFETGIQEINSIMETVKSLPTAFSKARALDFGCGIGRLTQALALHFEEVCGVDISPAMIETAMQYNKYGDRCKYYVNSSDDLPLFANNSFDFIYSNITLQHMNPQYAKKYIAEFVRILVPGGLMVFQLPSELVEKNPIKNRINALLPTPALELYRKTKFKFVDLYHQHPRMEMHGIRKTEVAKFLEKQNARIIEARIDKRETAEQHWVSFVYYVTKA